MSNTKRNTQRMDEYKEYELYQSSKGVLFNKTTLNQVIETMDMMLSKHSKVLVTRIDIHSPQCSDSSLASSDVSRILENVKRNIQNRNRGKKNKPDIHIVWTQERTSQNTHPHFHVMVFANGNAKQNDYGLKKEFVHQVQRRLHTDKSGLVEFCGSSGETGVLLKRNSPDCKSQKAEVVKMGSYLAKTRSKEFNPKNSRVSSRSFLL